MENWRTRPYFPFPQARLALSLPRLAGHQGKITRRDNLVNVLSAAINGSSKFHV